MREFSLPRAFVEQALANLANWLGKFCLQQSGRIAAYGLVFRVAVEFFCSPGPNLDAVVHTADDEWREIKETLLLARRLRSPFSLGYVAQDHGEDPLVF